jgi:LuxR family maltose regulon positive regulatory protein
VRGRGLVVRSTLIARLLRADDVRVVLLTAGAGYGKTTLLTQWAECDSRPFAWVSLGSAGDDPPALVAAIAGALDGLKDRTRPFVLVLDDMHVLRAPGSLACVSALVDDLPPAAQLAMAGRAEPGLPLARWAVQGDLLRIEADQLTLTLAEASLLIGDDLAPGELDLLLSQTEGWAAGLQMAGIRVRERRASGGPGASIRGHDRLVADYLRDEVLAPLCPDAVRFLSRTSMLERLCGPLCDAVLERDDSGAILRDIERSNLFVRPVDGLRGWYRCHPLLRELLLAELRLQDAALETELHRRASVWYEAAGEPAEAISHVRAVGDTKRAGDIVWANLPALLGRGETATLARWLADFADGEIAGQPTLALAAAWCGLAEGDAAAAQRWAAAAESGSYDGPLPGGPASPGAALAILRAVAGGEGVAAMAEAAELGLAGERGFSAWRAVACLAAGVAGRLSGDPEGARASLTLAEQVSISASAPASHVCVLAQLAVLAADESDWEAAAALLARARFVGERYALPDDAGTIELSAVSALVLAHLGTPASAAQEARRCLRLLSTPAHVAPWLAVEARILLARASLLVGDASAAHVLLREARRTLGRMADAGVLGERLEETWRRAEAFPLAGVVAPSALSRAELRVLRLLPTYLSYREIGERLHVSQCTVKSQALAAYRKLDVSSRSQAVERASALGLISAMDPLGLVTGLA